MVRGARTWSIKQMAGRLWGYQVWHLSTPRDAFHALSNNGHYLEDADIARSGAVSDSRSDPLMDSRVRVKQKSVFLTAPEGKDG